MGYKSSPLFPCLTFLPLADRPHLRFTGSSPVQLKGCEVFGFPALAPAVHWCLSMDRWLVTTPASEFLSTSVLSPAVLRCLFSVCESPSFFQPVGNYDQSGISPVSSGGASVINFLSMLFAEFHDFFNQVKYL
ncbi:hypothetical protein HAX54_030582 [Datura stramonium]|uniref:Uncharacterized protein n=1 Tax=Datura stramonium TaxID=4076 RepID=A0ABS8V955_DATST|nr:hypothetical protein [Datura stramonium]